MEKNKEFIWTDELVKEFMDKYNGHGNLITGIDPRGDKMKEFKKTKELTPTVNRCNYSDTHVYFHLSGEIPGIEITKERLAEILIAESKNELSLDKETVNDLKNGCKLYTEQELLNRMEEMFNEVNLLEVRGDRLGVYRKYFTFSDYMNRQK